MSKSIQYLNYSNYDRYQHGLASIVYKCFDKKSKKSILIF